ncbi:MAG: hypothetical protein MJ147_01440 [Clostridia bacterium]|nr:hypothetical protein [Clostridia bacterium]
MGEVKVLSYKYLVGAANVGWKSNSYSGSLTLDPQHHNAFDEEFKYRFFLRKEEEELKVVAQCFVGNVSFDCVDEAKIQELTFEGSDDGVQQAREWVQGAFDSIMANR